MSISSIIHEKCPFCGKLAQTVSEVKIASTIKLITYTCGHRVAKPIIKETDVYKNIVSEHGHKLYPFQIEGARFLEAAGFRAGILDEMGLGKTIQALAVIKAHPRELVPYMVLCKSGLRIQWFKMILEWLGEDFMPQIIDGSNDYVMEKAPGWIYSMDLLRRVRHKIPKSSEMKMDNNEDTRDELEKLVQRLGVKYVIIDECQLIKNNESQRTAAVRSICKHVERIVPLSGTPIKNQALEYFPILNILRPDKFPRLSHYNYIWVDTYWDGYKQRAGGLRNPQEFKRYTEDFLIRRTREEVMPELPTVTRDIKFFEMGPEVEKMYIDKWKQYQKEYLYGDQSNAFMRQSNLLAYVAEMRHIVGLALVEPLLDFVTEFLMDTDRKLTIFTHHIDVADIIEAKLGQLIQDGGYNFQCLRLKGSMNAEARDEVVEAFHEPKNRILIASTLAAGEGLNLQRACHDCIILERQWNPANEEQAECRFIRIGQASDKVTATYFIAVGTICEFFTEIVERKRAIVIQALDYKTYVWNESNIMQELMEVLALKGGKRWQLQ